MKFVADDDLYSYNRSFMLQNKPIESVRDASLSDRFSQEIICRFSDKKTILHSFTTVRLRYYKSFSINNLTFRVLENISISHNLISTLVASLFSIHKLVFQSFIACDKVP